MSRLEQLAPDLLVLSDLAEADGQVSWLPADARGWEPYNEYLLLEGERALLVDSGVPLHGPSLIATLSEVLGSRHLTVYMTRIEVDCLGNLAALVDAFDRIGVVTANPISPITLVHPRRSRASVPVRHLALGQTMEGAGFPQIDVLDPVLRTLGTSWLFDRQSRTLFSSDSFCGDLLADPAESIVHDQPGRLDRGWLRNVTVSKFDWIGNAVLPDLHKRWRDVFDIIAPDNLAPIHGRPQRGRAATQATIDAYETALFE